jgi:serine/threonine protein kinase
VFVISRAVKGGGNGVVFSATQMVNGSPTQCAIKFLRNHNGARFDRFWNEVQVLGQLNHPRIAKRLDSGQTDFGQRCPGAVSWMAMPLGGDNLRQHVYLVGQLPIPLVVKIGLQLCDALTHIHAQQFVHRDLKPDNVIWEVDVETGDVLLIDFGIAKRLDDDVRGRPFDSLTIDEEFVGPQNWASPELLHYARDKSHPVTFSSDLFQLGKLLWFIATDTTSAGIPSRRIDPTGGKLHALVSELLADDPRDRPESAEKVKALLQVID